MSSAFPPKVVVCVGAVVLKGATVLFVRQAYGGLKGTWSIPWGFYEGRTPEGDTESPESAALREAREEAGVEAQIVGFLGVQNHARSDGEGTVYLIFLCQHVAGEPQADSQETDRAAYLSLPQMDALDEPIDEFCRWVVVRVLSGRHQTIPPCADTPYAPYLAFL